MENELKLHQLYELHAWAKRYGYRPDITAMYAEWIEARIVAIGARP